MQPHVVKGDTIGDEDVIMTYCGLTNLGIAYSPKINQREKYSPVFNNVRFMGQP